MGLFDRYIPEPPLVCPVCGQALSDWQGKDEPCALLTWKQGQRFPIESEWPDECIEGDRKDHLGPYALPAFFEFYAFGCKCERRIDAYGYCENGVWVRSEIVTHLNFRPGPATSTKDERKIKKELQRWLESKSEA